MPSCCMSGFCIAVLLRSLMAEDDCLNYMELPSDLYEENFAAY